MHSDPPDPNAVPDPMRWLTLKEAAAVAGVAVKTWDLWSQAGRVPAGVWGRRPTGQKCKLWPAEAAHANRLPVAGEGAYEPGGAWITTDEAVAILGTTHKTWRREVVAGTAPAGTDGFANGSAAKL